MNWVSDFMIVVYVTGSIICPSVVARRGGLFGEAASQWEKCLIGALKGKRVV